MLVDLQQRVVREDPFARSYFPVDGHCQESDSASTERETLDQYPCTTVEPLLNRVRTVAHTQQLSAEYRGFPTVIRRNLTLVVRGILGK